LGEEGKQRYRCKRCKCTVNLKGEPTSERCPVGTFHEWEKLT
jgi:transposase-like protein